MTTRAASRSRAVTAAQPSIAEALAGVEVLWIPPGEPPPPRAWRFCVRWLDPRPRSAAVRYLESARGFEPAAGPGEPAAPHATVALFGAPALDEVVALAMWLWERAGRGRPAGKGWEAVAYYADNVRQGLLPEKVPPTVAPQAVYRAIAEERLVRDRTGFLEHAVWLVELLVEKVQAGRSLFDDDLVSDEPFLVEYLELLRADERHYRDDLRRSQRFVAHVPDASGARTALPLLAVRNPKATRFRVWAQRDPKAPGGAGWPLLLIEKPPVPGTPRAPDVREFQLTATVAAKVSLGFLAEPLTQRELWARRAGIASATEWYAGEDYGGRMVASPETGSRLLLKEVLEVLEGPLLLQRFEWPWSPARRRAFIALAAAFLAAILLVLPWPGVRGTLRSWFTPRERQATATGEPASADRGVKTPLPPGALTREAFLARRDLALLVATERYRDPGWPNLKQPVRQARLLEQALKARGFEVKLLENPTLKEFQRELDLTRTRPEGWGPYDQFLLYFAGHGSVSALRAGRLVLADSSGDDANYLSLADLRVWLRDHTSRHVLVMLDSCYSGSFSLDPPKEFQGKPAPISVRGRFGVDEDVARQKLAPRVRRYLTAVGRDVTPDESRFTEGVIEMLRGAEGQPAYLTDLLLAAGVEDVHPPPQYGRFEGDEEAGAVVFRPPP